ncbi:unnamed protein product, partial [Prorocentrum cordatum]
MATNGRLKDILPANAKAGTVIMEADEADMTDAVDRVAGLGAEKKRELFEALKS